MTGAQATQASSAHGAPDASDADRAQSVDTPSRAASRAPIAAPTVPALQTLFEFDPQSNRLSWSNAHAAAAMTGASGSEMAGTDDYAPSIDLDTYLSTLLPAHVERRTNAVAHGEHGYACEYQFCHADGRYLWVEERGGWIGQGENRRLVGVIRSIDAQKQREERLSWLAQHDELTGLLNRVSLRACLDSWLSETGAEGRTGAYFLVGVDDLGAVNADFGFEIADQVIVEVARRLQSKISADDYLGRVAGTKFGILIHDANENSVRTIVTNILNGVRESIVETHRGGIAASVSIGTVLLPEFASSSQQAMASAEAALDEAKRLGKANWATFSRNTDHISMRRRNSQMSDVILTALNERRIQLAFQPIVGDIDQHASKFECLIRMRDAQNEIVPAPEFIPAAERLGLVHLLDRRVLELATNTLAECPNIHLNVNISMETVKDAVWAEGYIAHLRANEPLAKRITVELTETQVVDAVDQSIEFVSEIKKLGCAFAIDDFGAGYTSFRNLKALEIDVLKIDGSFVTGVALSRDNQLFVRTLLDLARNFGMKTVAEWVDNEADAMLLKGLGVDYLQGYLLGKPEIFPVWLPEGAPNKAPFHLTRT
ncbi:MAG: EAL domain-containing protein [Pseudomonadota bacterium]